MDILVTAQASSLDFIELATNIDAAANEYYFLTKNIQPQIDQ
ncbi:hypothetical protein [Shewanella polaris]|nr:hypothetical protein [Shewanella polaris]